MYRGGRPGRLAAAVNRAYGWLFARRWAPVPLAATLEVRGRRTGEPVTLPVVVADVDGVEHLVSMLGEHAGWVRNVRAAHGRAVLLRGGRRQDVRLVEVPVGRRGPVLRRYLAVAPGARPHVPVARDAPLADLERVAADFPVFRVEPDAPDAPDAPA
ncbi:nitroreductase family deazaflavin-dependent oxidoreductase [Cellulomonas fimi]|nr:nitroreductase family deazaflavin-dependent oxidoreductase [Cellulomonas fimi]